MTATANPQLQRRWLPWAPKAITQSQGGEIFFFPGVPGAQKPGQVGAHAQSKPNGMGGSSRLCQEEERAPRLWLQDLAF